MTDRPTERQKLETWVEFKDGELWSYQHPLGTQIPDGRYVLRQRTNRGGNLHEMALFGYENQFLAGFFAGVGAACLVFLMFDIWMARSNGRRPPSN